MCVACMLLITGPDREEVSDVWEVVVLWRLLLFVWLWSRKAYSPIHRGSGVNPQTSFMSVGGNI